MDWALLEALDPEDRTRLLAAAVRRRYRRGEVVFHEGDPGDTLHLVAKGHLVVRMTTPLGDVVTLLVLGPGDFFGELALVSPGAVRNATVAALDAVQTVTLHRNQFDELRQRRPSIDRFLVAALAAEVRRLSAALVEALFVPVEKRVLRRLADLVRLYGDGDDGPVLIPLTQEDLAGLAGTTRPSVNKVLRTAEEAGLVHLSRGRVEILDRIRLARRAR